MMMLRELYRLFFPATCAVCARPLLGNEHLICTHCLLNLPQTYDAGTESNLLEKKFIGRVPFEAAASLMQFVHGNPAQAIVHNIKYHNNIPLAHAMGRLLGQQLSASRRFESVDLLVPIPLHGHKQRLRGYNQCLEICRGIAQTFPRPISTGDLVRVVNTRSQTRSRSRKDNIHNAFFVRHPESLQGRHLLLVDDVCTTGATLIEAARQLATLPNTRISIAVIAMV